MKTRDVGRIDGYVARARLALSILGLVSIYVDPVVGGPFAIETAQLAVLLLHLAYSAAALWYVGVRGPSGSSPFAFAALDVAFASAIAAVTEGATSPSYVFFCFAIVAIGCREGLRATLEVTVASMVLYLAVIVLFHGSSPYVMRPAYLGLIGCLVGFLGQQRVDFEARTADLEAAAARRSIARALHDGHVQALAASNLRLEACRELLRRGDVDEALRELTGLQASVTREYDAVRSYIRELADAVAGSPVSTARGAATSAVRVRADFTAPAALAEEILQIIVEGLRNSLRHGSATTVSLEASADDGAIRIHLDDDGVGFPPSSPTPWSIASRVNELGGSIRVDADGPKGAHVAIQLPGSEP